MPANEQRIGRDESLRVDVRLLVATSRDLFALIASGHFREDLYDRLTFFEVRVSPLRDRLCAADAGGTVEPDADHAGDLLREY